MVSIKNLGKYFDINNSDYTYNKDIIVDLSNISDNKIYLQNYLLCDLIIPSLINEIVYCSSKLIFIDVGDEILIKTLIDNECDSLINIYNIAIHYHKKGNHSVTAIVQKINSKTIIEYYDPNGFGDINIHNIIKNYFDNIYNNYEFVVSGSFCPNLKGIQKVLQFRDGGGCAIFTNIYILFRIFNPEVSIDKLNNFLFTITQDKWNKILYATPNLLLVYAFKKKIINAYYMRKLFNSNLMINNMYIKYIGIFNIQNLIYILNKNQQDKLNDIISILYIYIYTYPDVFNQQPYFDIIINIYKSFESKNVLNLLINLIPNYSDVDFDDLLEKSLENMLNNEYIMLKCINFNLLDKPSTINYKISKINDKYYIKGKFFEFDDIIYILLGNREFDTYQTIAWVFEYKNNVYFNINPVLLS